MEPQLKNKMTNILCSISLIKNPNLDTLNLMKEIIKDNYLDKSVESDIMKQINEANNPTDLVNVLKEIVSSEKTDFKTDFETFFKTIEKNINQEEQRIHNKNEMVEKLSNFLQTIKQAFENKSIIVSDIAAEIKTQSSLIDKNYKENARKSFTKKWLTGIKGLEYNKDKDKEYLTNLKKVLSQKPKIFEGFGAAISNKEVQKDLKKLINLIDEKIKAYS